MGKIKALIRNRKNRLKTICVKIYQQIRKVKYRFFSSIQCCNNKARLNQPTLMIGQGLVRLGQCNLGVWPSPYYLNGYIHLEARESTAMITIEDGVWINNNAVIIAERNTISIGANTLIGSEFTAYDSDFHDLHPQKRMAGTHQCQPVTIGKNVFIGSRVTILKGVTIGDNAVIAAGSVVSINVPCNNIAGGVPARLLGELNSWDKKNE